MAVTVDCTFDTYLHGEENLEVFKCLRSFADNPVGVYYLTGKNSSGKTHLLAAIENHLKNTSTFTVARLSVNVFRNQLRIAIKNGTIRDFYRSFEGIDVLLLDDCQFLGLDSELVVKMCQKEEKGIILAGDCLPDALANIKSLRVMYLSEPSYATRRQLLLRFLQNKGLVLKMDVVDYIASNLKNVRRIQGFVTWLSARNAIDREHE